MIAPFSPISARSLYLLAFTAVSAIAAEAPRIVFEGGRSLPLDGLTAQGDKFVVKAPAEGFTQGQTFPMALASHVSGEKPTALNQGISLLLLDEPKKALELLDPLVEQLRVTARVPGNNWLEAAKAALVANALTGAAAKADALGKEISDATPAPGNDPILSLGKALLIPSTTKIEDRILALGDLAVESSPPEVSAYASYFQARLLKQSKRDQEALESYLSIPSLYPTGGMILNAAAELGGAEILAILKRRDEAVALLTSATREAKSTGIGEEAAKRLQSLQ